MSFAIALIIYSTIVFGIHGGEGITGINRQLRNLLCALPFGIICYLCFGWQIGLVCFCMAYGGASLSFDRYSLWFKGMITCPFGGFITLPLAYYIGNKTKWTNVTSEYLSGAFYGTILAILIILGRQP